MSDDHLSDDHLSDDHLSDDHEPSGDAVDLSSLHWPAPQPPSGFAERATARFLSETATAPDTESTVEASTDPPRRTRGLVFVFAGGALAVAAAVTLWFARPTPSTAAADSVVTQAMQTIIMSDRAVAVAGPGTSLRWAVDADGEGVVEQDRGSVFYRVADGGAFEVKTPAGTISVTGTCFEVETRPMQLRSGLKAATVGAALAGAIVVTVYEGGVVLANDHGDIELGPGQRALADIDSAPRRWDGGADDDAPGSRGPGEAATAADSQGAVAQVRRQERALEQAHAQQLTSEAEIEKLRRQVADLGGSPGEPSAAELKVRARKCASQGRGGECPFLDPDPETLREMARCASVKVDFPGFLDNVESPEVAGYARNLGITDPKEVAALQAAADAHYDQFNDRLRKIFLELGGDAEMAQDASAATMESYIGDQLDRELMGDVQRRIAEERAGLREPPADLAALSIEEQSFRLQAGLGNQFEAHLAEHLGAGRARELRRVNDGWPGSTSVQSGDCIDPE